MNGPPKSPRRLRDVVAVGMLAILALAGPAARPAAAQGGAGSETAISIPSESPEPGQANPGNQPTIPTRNLWSILVDGGPLMIPIAACSLILLAFVFERFISLRRGRVIPKPFVTRLLQQIEDGELERDEALELCEQNGSPVAEVFAGAELERVHEQAHYHAPAIGFRPTHQAEMTLVEIAHRRHEVNRFPSPAALLNPLTHFGDGLENLHKENLTQRSLRTAASEGYPVYSDQAMPQR
mgnify:CR=1 FL=1